jgi:ribosome-binding protein aMBF1 (putative translation factor)
MEKRIVNCRLCGRPMNVPTSIMMVFTFDPSVCRQCRTRVPKGDWDTAEDEPTDAKSKRPTQATTR